VLTSRLQLLPLILFLCSLAVVGQTASPQYTVTDLGDFTPRAMNSSTTVVGSMGNHAVLWRNGVLTNITPTGGVQTVAVGVAHGINDLDQAVGRVTFCDLDEVGNCRNGRTRAFIFNLVTQTQTVLGTLGGRDSWAWAINNAGEVSGWSHVAGSTPGTSGDEHAFIFQNGAFEDIGAKTTGGNSNASSINATGQLAGWVRARTINGDNGAFLYSAGSFAFVQATSTAFDINNAGQVVGVMGGNDDGSGQAFIFSGGVVQDLGKVSPGHTYANASAINNAGHVVGVSSPSFFFSSGERAFIFRDGVMQDLNNLIPANSGWVLARAVDINDAGQIVGNGFKDGQPKAFLLTPTQPLLITEPNSTKAVVVETIWYLRDPFSLQTPVALSPDRRTRLTIVARNIEVVAGENIPAPTVQTEDAQHQLVDLPVEFIGKVPGATWLTQITVRLPDQLNTAGEIQLRISFRGQTSNAGSIILAASP
jgi:probable HAF family extracellular repeat protein